MGKIKLSELQPRVYDGKNCISFFKTVEVEESPSLIIQFTKVAEKVWHYSAMLYIEEDCDINICGNITIAKDSVPLAIVAEIGLERVKNKLADIAQYCMKNSLAVDSALYGV